MPREWGKELEALHDLLVNSTLRGLFIYGGRGMGKTTCALALGKQLKEQKRSVLLAWQIRPVG